MLNNLLLQKYTPLQFLYKDIQIYVLIREIYFSSLSLDWYLQLPNSFSGTDQFWCFSRNSYEDCLFSNSKR